MIVQAKPLAERFDDIQKLAREAGLGFFETYFEVVPIEIMHEVAAYGLPTRAQHWSYGKVYNHQKIHGEMGLSKIYEIVLNNDPCYAFLLDTNPDVANLLVAAHVFGHCDFFKNNNYFAGSNRNMVNEAVDHALRIDEYIGRYGLERVERLMDIGFALDRHIDPRKGVPRKPYPAREVVEVETHAPDSYGDMFGDRRRAITRKVIGDRLPPHPERDLLWFLGNYARLEPWERDVLEIIRSESYYFYPQFETKIMNEGWASYWHAELLNRYDDLTPEETLEFGVLHSSVVHPGSPTTVNPYYLGFKIFHDIRKRFGDDKLFEARRDENDLSFVRNYLTEELAEELKLFTFGYRNPRKTEVEVKSRNLNEVIEALSTPRYNYGAPRVVVQEVKDNALHLEQLRRDLAPLDQRYAEKTLEYVYELWKAPVHLLARDEDREVRLSYTIEGFKAE